MADKHIEDKLKNRLANHQVSPSSGAWETIEYSLPTARIPIWKMASIALLLLLVGGAGYIYYGKDSGSSDDVLNAEDQISSIDLNKNEQGKTNENPIKIGVDPKKAEVIQNKKTLPPKPSKGKLDNPQSLRVNNLNEESISTNQSSEPIDFRYLNVNALDILARMDYLDFKLPIGQITIPLFNQVTAEVPMIEKHEKEKKLLEDRKSTLYFQAMPSLTYNRIEANQNDDEWISDVNKIPILSTDRVGIRLEMGMLHAINKRWEVFAGLLYFSRSQLFQYSVNNVDSLIGESKDDDISIVPKYSQETREYNYHLQNVGVQVGVNYLLKSNKFVTSFGSGVELHKSLRSSSDGVFNEPNLYIFYNFYYRIEYPKEKRFRLMAQPTFNYSLNIAKQPETPFYIKPYGLGLNFGFTFKL